MDSLGQDMDVLSSGRMLAVLCTDARTGRPVEGSNVRLVMEHARPPILKEDCYRIFTHIEGDKTVIHCGSRLYKPVDVEVDLKKWDGSEVFEIELEPGESYPKDKAPLSFDEGTE